MRVFVDLDGVLFDFAGAYKKSFGVEAILALDNVDWALVRGVPGFYRKLPLMPDAMKLWRFIAPMDPVILTGVPKKVPGVADDKRAAVAKHLGEDVRVFTCASKDKCLFANPGDLLIDDWEKYRHLWIAKGGKWITHVTAAETIARVTELLDGEEKAG
jgi:hypothetical protein